MALLLLAAAASGTAPPGTPTVTGETVTRARTAPTVSITVSETATAISATVTPPAVTGTETSSAPWGWIAAVLGATAVGCVALVARRR